MFELSKTKAKVVDFNPRAELHGNDGKLAGDIKFSVVLSADILAHFDPTLRSFLFHKRAGVQDDLANEAHDAPNLRFPQMTVPVKWEMELVGAELTIHHGLGGRSDIVLSGCKVNAFALEPKEGGSVIVGFRVQAPLDEKIAGKLCALIQESPEITIEPPAADESMPAAA